MPQIVDLGCAVLALAFILYNTTRTFDGYSLLLIAFIFSLIASFTVDRIIKPNRTRSWRSETTSTKSLQVLRFPVNIALYIVCIVALNKYIPAADVINLKAQVNEKILTHYYIDRDSNSFSIEINIDDHGKQRIRLKRRVWDKLQVGDDVSLTAQKGLFGYYVVSDVNQLNRED